MSLSRHYSISRGKKRGAQTHVRTPRFSPISSPLSAFVYPLRISIHAPFRAFLALWDVSIQPARCRPPIPSPRIQPKSKQNILNVWRLFFSHPCLSVFSVFPVVLNVLWGIHRQRQLSSWPTSIRSIPSKSPVPLPEEILITLRSLLFLPSRESTWNDSKKRIPPPILIDQQRDFPFKKRQLPTLPLLVQQYHRRYGA